MVQSNGMKWYECLLRGDNRFVHTRPYALAADVLCTAWESHGSSKTSHRQGKEITSWYSLWNVGPLVWIQCLIVWVSGTELCLTYTPNVLALSREYRNVAPIDTIEYDMYSYMAISINRGTRV